MGRAGAGGGGVRHSSGGVHTSSRSSGVHHVGSSSRPSSRPTSRPTSSSKPSGSLGSFNSTTSRSSSKPYTPPPRQEPPRREPPRREPPRHHHHTNTVIVTSTPTRTVYHETVYRDTSSRNTNTSSMGSSSTDTINDNSKSTMMWCLVGLGVVILVLVLVMMSGSSGNNGNNSTIVREPITDVGAYMNNCVVDEIGWINNPTKLSSQLKYFWDKTGVQPYIYMKAYDPLLTSESAKVNWAETYYDTNFTQENIFLVVYFGEEYVEEVQGDAIYVSGAQTSYVMDAEAVDIFWNNFDYYWDSWDADDTDGMFVQIFTKTADTIMRVPTNGWDVLKVILPIVGVCIVIGLVIRLILVKRKAEAERAAETERILSTPMQDLMGQSDSYADELAKKYENNQS